MSSRPVEARHNFRFPNESAEYRDARNRLLEAEMALRRQIEAVAAQRRALPPGGLVPEDYIFEEGDDARQVRLSEIFGEKSVLLLYSYMFGPAMAQPCPSCTSILDSLDGEAVHISQRLAIAAVARSPISRFRVIAKERGWNRLRLLSSETNSYHRDYHGEDMKGAQLPILNVFARSPDGTIRHVYATELMFAPREPGQDPRHIDSIWPLWGALDFSPQGRGSDTRPKLNYDSGSN
jgi:predicted dithiol-disulfide oxidoreductase (DUF899 family)